MGKDLNYYLNGGSASDDMDELMDGYNRGLRERRQAKLMVDEELGDEQVEYRDWNIFDN